MRTERTYKNCSGDVCLCDFELPRRPIATDQRRQGGSPSHAGGATGLADTTAACDSCDMP